MRVKPFKPTRMMGLIIGNHKYDQCALYADLDNVPQHVTTMKDHFFFWELRTSLWHVTHKSKQRKP